MTIAAIWARTSRPELVIWPFEPFSRPFCTALRRPAADQSVGKSVKSSGEAANAFVGRSIAPAKSIARVRFLFKNIFLLVVRPS